MSSKPSTLAELEKATYRSRWRDGLMDLLGGVGVILVGVSWRLDMAWATGMAVPILLVIWLGLRRSIVEPRIGRVTFTRARQEKEKKGNLGILLLGLGLLLLAVVAQAFFSRSAGGMTAWARDWAAAIPVTLLAIMAIMVSTLTGLTRFWGYAALLFAIGTITTPLGVEPPGQMLLSGAVITLVGLIIFLRFLSSSPAPADLGEAQ